MKLRPASALTPPAAWPVRDKLTGDDDYICHPRPCPTWSGAFSFLKFLEVVEVVLWRELATGAAAARGGGRRGVELVDPKKGGQSVAVKAAD